MNFKEAMEINGNVASWYMDTFIFGNNAKLPTYTKERMLEAFGVVEKKEQFQAGGR